MLVSTIISAMAYFLSLSAGLSSDNLFFQAAAPAWTATAEESLAVLSDEVKAVALGRPADAVLAEPELKLLPERHLPPASPIKLPETSNYDITAGSGVVIDNNNEVILFKKNAKEVRPIASITKLITALVFLEYNPGWDKIYEVKAEDRREGGKIYLFTGDKVRIKDLFFTSLVGSANSETVALVHSAGMSEEEFAAKMNAKAQTLGLKNTFFYDVVGLNDANVSTAPEVARIAKIALNNRDIREATLTKKYEFVTLGGRKKVVYNTDALLDIFLPNGIKIMGGKTGHTDKAGYNFVGKFIDHNGHEVISVILGDIDKDARFSQTHDLVQWAYNSYQW